MPKIGNTPNPIYLGIDPGASGGLVAISGKEVIACPMPETEQDIWSWINLRSEPFGDTAFAVIEKVWGHIGQNQPGSAMFKFGASYGSLKMALTAARIPYEEVVPQRWQKGMGMGSRGKTESKREWKGRLRARAQQLFPQISVTLAIADALLIAEYARRLRRGAL